MAAVRANKNPGVIRNDFDSCVPHIVPYCPVSTNMTAGTKRGAAEILEINADNEEAQIESFGEIYVMVPNNWLHL